MKDLLRVSRWMALGAIALCSIATVIAYFSIESVSFLTTPILGLGIFLWVLSVVWFMWGWLKNANLEGNERQGISASSYILAFLPLSYCYLLATDEARTKITVHVENRLKPMHSIKIYGGGSIFLNPDTLKLAGLGVGESSVYEVKASTHPNMQGTILMEGFIGKEKFKKDIAGPFSINPMKLQQDWDVVLDADFLK